MKTELSRIAQDLEQGKITENEAQALLLGLLGVSGSLVSPNSIQKEAEKYQQVTANKMAIERTAFAQGALWGRSLFLTHDR